MNSILIYIVNDRKLGMRKSEHYSDVALVSCGRAQRTTCISALNSQDNEKRKKARPGVNIHTLYIDLDMYMFVTVV